MLKRLKKKSKSLDEIINYFEKGWKLEKSLKVKSKKDYTLVSPEARKYFFSDLKQSPDCFTTYEYSLEDERLEAMKFLKLLSKKKIKYISNLIEKYCK